MNADEIVMWLRQNNRKSGWTDIDRMMDKSADLIESLQAENARLRAERDAAGMIESLQTQLAEAQRRAEAAIKDMKCYIGRVLSPKHGNYACCICKHADNDCGMLGRCNGLRHWEWRGPQE